MKIVSYNLHMGLEPEAILKNITDFAAQGVNVFCLQEFWKWMQPVDLEELLLKTLGTEWQMEYIASEKPYRDYGLCILWKKSILTTLSFECLPLPLLSKAKLWEKAFILLKGFKTPLVQRGAYIGTFALNDKRLRITTLHLDWAGGLKQRMTQLAYLKGYLASLPKTDFEVICGDFNTIGVFNKKKQTKVASDILGKEFYNTCNTPGVTCPPFFHLDYMFVKNLRVANFKICKLAGSDHFPIMSKLL